MYRHSNPQNFLKSGFDHSRPGFSHLGSEPVSLTESQISRAVENAVTVPPEVSDAEPKADSEPEQYAPGPVTELPSSDLQERATAYARKLAGALWDGVQNYKFPQKDEALRTRQTELFSELLGIIAHAGEFFSHARTIKMQVLEEEHEEVRVQCRATVEAINDLQTQLGPLDGLLRGKQTKSSQARVLFNSLSGSKPKAEQYPSAREIAAWEKEVEKARAALDAALAAEGEVNKIRQQMVREIREQRELLDGRDGQDGLKHKEAALRAQIEGRPYHEHSTGLEVPAEF